MKKLALNGGNPVIEYDFKKYISISSEEVEAAKRVVETGTLSDFLGKWHEKFYGGENVRKFESDWSSFFKVKDTITFNSATSALCAAIGACQVGPGDEVIVSPYTMAATATSIISYNAIPVFADIDSETFNMTPESIIKNITHNTRAILIPSIIGHPARLEEIVKIARDHNLKVIEDACQAPMATLSGKYAGTYGDIGVFSLNKHKHIQTGEGGIAVTSSPELGERLRLIRNHGEVTADSRGIKNLVNTFGFNFRMGEIEAAIGIEQLKKLEKLVKNRVETMEYLTEKLESVSDYIQTPFVKDDSTHVYYLYAMKYKRKKGMPSREKIVEALCAEGFPVRNGFQKPLYLFSMFQNRIAYGDKGCPFACPMYKGSVSYEKGICPTAESLEENSMITFHVEHVDLTKEDVDLIAKACEKVFSNIEEVQ
jgi:perosamine synthetase